MNEKELNEAFKNTSYEVKLGETTEIISLTGKNLWIAGEFPAENNHWCYITAWNPLPTIYDLDENRKRNKVLEEYLISQKYSFYHGKGISKTGDWSEESFFVLGIDYDTSQKLAAVWGQKAIIIGKADSEGCISYCEEVDRE